MNSHSGHFDPFSKKSNKVTNYSKNEIIWHGALLCVLVDSKNNKLEFWPNFQKNASQKGVSSINMYMFQAKWPNYGHFCALVYVKVPIFDTYVYLGMSNNGAKLGF